MAVSRSCVSSPTIAPLTAILKERCADTMVLIMVALAMGSDTSPTPRKGWPKARTRSPSTVVTVPVAAMSTSPRTSTADTDDPGIKTLGAAPAPALPPATGSKPMSRSHGSKCCEIAVGTPDTASGVAIGTTPSTGWTPTGDWPLLRACHLGSSSAVSRHGRSASGSFKTSSMSLIGVMPAIGSLAKVEKA